MKRFAFLLCAAIALALCAHAQKKVQLVMFPDHADGIYRIGENPQISLIALDCGLPLNGISVDYEISEDLMPAHEKKTITLKGNQAKISLGKMKKSGFVRIKASVTHNGKKYSSMSTVGCEPEKLKPVTVRPADFDQFWAIYCHIATTTATPHRIEPLFPYNRTIRQLAYSISHDLNLNLTSSFRNESL